MGTSNINAALSAAYKKARKLGEREKRVVKSGLGFGKAHNDTEIAADRTLAETVVATLMKDRRDKIILVEGYDSTIYGESKHPETLITVDPLDGSLNFKRCNGSLGLPYSTVIAEFDTSNPKFSDCTVAGLVDLRTGDTWTAKKNVGCILNDKLCFVSDMRTVDAKAGTVIITDLYYHATRYMVAKAFDDFRGYVRSSGSAGYEMALVASGSVDAFMSAEQKCDVLGAGYLMITAAGGVVIDFRGEDIGELPYEFKGQIPIIAAATPELANELITRIYNGCVGTTDFSLTKKINPSLYRS